MDNSSPEDQQKDNFGQMLGIVMFHFQLHQAAQKKSSIEEERGTLKLFIGFVVAAIEMTSFLHLQLPHLPCDPQTRHLVSYQENNGEKHGQTLKMEKEDLSTMGFPSFLFFLQNKTNALMQLQNNLDLIRISV